MNFNLNLNKRFVQALVVMVCLNFASCDLDVRPGQLDGEWELKTVNGQPLSGGDIITWEFEKDGDFTICADGDCYKGDWEWETKREELEITYTDDFGDAYRSTFEVDMLDKDVLEGDWLIDGDIYILEFERD